MKADEVLRTETNYLAARTVAVTQPKRGTPTQEITLPASIQAYADAPIYARTNGYLRRWFADIGTHVKAGQLLAAIDTPEIEHQVAQARADLSTSQANLHLAEITSSRYQDLLKTDAVSRQEVDKRGQRFSSQEVGGRIPRSSTSNGWKNCNLFKKSLRRSKASLRRAIPTWEH